MPEETPFIGRREELAYFGQACGHATRGEGRLVLLGGETGIGKSRLADEVLRRASSAGFTVLRARCLAESIAPYLPVYEALKSGGLSHLLSLSRPPRVEYLYLAAPRGFEIASAERVASALDRDIFLSMLSAVESFVKDSMEQFAAGESRRLNALGYGEYRIIILARPFGSLVVVIKGTESEELVEALEAALDKIERQFGGELNQWDGNRTASEAYGQPLREILSSGKFDGQEEAVDPKDRKYKVLEGLSRGLARESARKPIALFLDDLQLADSATVSAIQYLARNNRRTALLLLATFRTEDLAGPQGASAPLAAARAALKAEGLAEELLLGPLDEAEVRRLAEEQLGVKDLDSELVTALHRETRGAPFFAIETLRYLNQEGRLERIGGSVRLKGSLDAAQLPSHLREAVHKRLAHIPRAERDILECSAVDGEVFRPGRVAAALELRKLQVLRVLRNLEEDHHLVRLRGEAAAFEHAKIREVVYQGIHADLRREYHLAVAQAAVEEMQATGEDLTEVIAHHYAQARDPRGKGYILKAAERASAAFSNLEAARWYEVYFSLAGEEAADTARAAYANALLYGGKFERAANVLEGLVKRAPAPAQRDRALRSLVEAIANSKGFDEAVKLMDRWQPGEEDTIPWATWAVHRSRYAIRLGDVNRAEGDVSRALPILHQKAASRFDIAEAYSVLAFIGETVGDYDACIENGKRAIEAAGEDLPIQAMYYNNVGVGLLFRGRYEDGAKYLARGLEIAESRTDFFRIALISNNFGLLNIRRGQVASAREHLNRGLRVAERIEAPFLTGMALDLLGVCALEEGRHADASEFFERALPVTDRAGDRGEMTWLRLHLATLELERGDPQAALARSDEAFELAALSGDAPGQAVARAITGSAHAALGDRAGAERMFKEAERGLQFSPAQFEYAEVLRHHGRWLASNGRTQEAAEKFTRAREVFEELGAIGRVKAVVEAARGLGARPAASPEGRGA